MIPGIVAGRVLSTPPLFPNDPSYASVVSLLHFNGADASTRIVDQRRPYIWTPNGNVQLDTAQSKAGGSSCLFDGSGDYLSIPANADFNLSGDFTVECWVRLNSLAAINGIWYLGNVTTNPIARMSFDIKTDGSGSLFGENAGGTQLIGAVAPAGTFTTGVWFHLACTRAGNALTVWKNGVSVGTGTATGTPVTTNVFQIGIARSGGAQRFLNGWLDSFRITNGVARYSTTFTPEDQNGETSGSILDDSWNPYLADSALTFSNADHTIVRPFSGNDGPDNSAVSKRARSYGKVYAECTMNRDGGGWSGYFGFIDAGVNIATISSENYTTGIQLAPSRNFTNTMRIVREGVGASVSGAYASGVVVAAAIDIDAGKAWIRCDDDWIKSDLSKTTSFDASSPTGTWSPTGRNWRLFAMSPFAGTECTLNVGATAFARTPPPGFGAW